MVRLDHGRFSKAGLNNIRIDGSLYQEVNCTDFLCLFLKYTDKLLTDDFSLLLRICLTGQLIIETLLSIDTDKV